MILQEDRGREREKEILTKTETDKHKLIDRKGLTERPTDKDRQADSR